MLASKNKNMVEIVESLIILGHQDAARQIQDASETCNCEMDALALALKTLSVEKINERTNRLIKRAKIQKPKYFSRLINIPERKLDLDYLAELEALDFIKDGHNLVVWGSPGTGKSWMLDAIATKACEQGLKTRTMTFPALYRELDKLNKRNSASFESRLKYYSKFKVLCIDEFPNKDIKEVFLIQEFFSEMEKNNVLLVVGSQSAPENWPKLISVLSLGQSMTGRIAGNAKRLHLEGPDLRYRTDLDLD